MLTPDNGQWQNVRISDIQWDNGDGLEDLALWGIHHARGLVQALEQVAQTMYGDGNDGQRAIIESLAYAIDIKLEDTYQALYRMMGELSQAAQ